MWVGDLQAPFPWFGGKSAVADVVWERLGADVPVYIEPFGGSLAVLLARPGGRRGLEIVNDADGFISNFWRAVKADPDAVARYADWPVNENDLHARHYWLVQRRESLTARLEGDPEYYDAKIAGWWVWGQCASIGGGWCAGDGPWRVRDGLLVREGAGPAPGVHQLARERGVHRGLPHLTGSCGVHREVGDDHAAWLREWMRALSDRLRHVKVCSGDWKRVVSDAVRHGRTAGVLLDPPYSPSLRSDRLYVVDGDVASEVREWALTKGQEPAWRIALCGYLGEHEMPGWSMHRWKAVGGYGNQDGENENARKETIWFSPHCLPPVQGRLL